jgi:hypothetical protein
MRPLKRRQRLWRLLPPFALGLLALLALAETVAVAAPPAPVQVLNESAPGAIPGQYIVVFKEAVAFSDVQAAERTVRSLGGTIVFRYTSALVGFSVKLPATALEALRALPGVAWIEADQRVSLDTIQFNPPKGLDRTSERKLPLDSQYTYSETGAGVHAYVIDTGIWVTHNEFGGRAAVSFDAFGSTGLDCHGHGTHVAGTIGGSTYGIAKNVQLHGVRVLDCGGSGTWSGVIAGVDWVTNNAIHPAVANMSLGGGSSPAVDTAVTNSIASGVTYAVAAGNNNGGDACIVSPARVPAAITVGAVDPTNDTRASFSNIGTCLDLFGPGVNILSAWNTNNTATNAINGTSMATPHVAGVAALYLQNHTLATPATVWGAIHYDADVSTTPGWAGVINPGTGSPNELLHWGSVPSDGYNDGDPHLTTVDGVHYDFQSTGEFVSLRDGGSLQIQTRQTPVGTTFNPGPNPYTGLATCVSLNTAVAALVGKNRVTFQPKLSGIPDPSGLQLRVDGVLTTLGANGLNLGSGGRVTASAGGGIRIDFPDGTVLIVTPGWWASQSKWYLSVSVLHTPALEGIMGAIAPGSWLPALPDGTSLGPMPASLHQRYLDLNQKFADAWRVTAQTSLFDYARGTSTKTFTFPGWPLENPPCVIPKQPPVKPLDPQAARRACRPILDKNRNADCVFDVTVTGEPGFAKTYQLVQQIQAGSTTITVSDNEDPTQAGAPVTSTATVARTAAGGQGTLAGTVQFVLDGSKVGAPVKLDPNGRATWKTSSLKAGNHQVSARYIPASGSVFLASSSLDEPHTVTGLSERDCVKTVVVSGLHYPDKTCAQSAADFQAGLLTSFHFTSKCPPDAPLKAVFDISCQNAPIPGFSTGSVYQGTACCGKAARPVTTSSLPAQ